MLVRVDHAMGFLAKVAGKGSLVSGLGGPDRLDS
jgi:hypothetical protein